MHFITSDKELLIEYDGGNFTFGDIVIKTRDDDFEKADINDLIEFLKEIQGEK